MRMRVGIIRNAEFWGEVMARKPTPAGCPERAKTGVISGEELTSLTFGNILPAASAKLQST